MSRFADGRGHSCRSRRTDVADEDGGGNGTATGGRTMKLGAVAKAVTVTVDNRHGAAGRAQHRDAKNGEIRFRYSRATRTFDFCFPRTISEF